MWFIRDLAVQVIYGPNVTVIKSNLEDYLETAPDTLETPAESVETPEVSEQKEDAGTESCRPHCDFQPDHWCSG